MTSKIVRVREPLVRRRAEPVQFSQGSESVLGRLVRQGKDLLGAHWSKLNSILFTPDLYAIQQVKNKALWREGRVLWDMMALDDKVDSAHTSWTSAVVQDVRMVPADDTAESKWIADGFTRMLEEVPGGILDKFYMMLSGAGQGFSLMPFDIKVMGEGAWQGWFGLADIRYMLPHFLQPVFDERQAGDGELLSVVQVDPYNRSEVTQIDLDRAIHWVNRPQDNPFSGRSLYATAHIHWQAKHLLIQLRNYLAELNVGHLVVGHDKAQGGPGGMSETEFVRRAEPIIANYLRYKGLKKWHGMTLDFVKNEAPLSAFNETIRACDHGITRGIGPPWLADEEGEYGTRAQSEVHASQFELKIRPVRQRTSEGFREKVVAYVGRRNGWASRHWPKVLLERAPETDQQKTVTAYLDAVARGLKPIPADQNEVRSRLRWPLLPEQDQGDQDAAVQALALTGAQIDSAKTIVSEVAAGTMPLEAARAMLTGFLPIPPDVADAILKPFLDGFRPPLPAASGAAPPQQPQLRQFAAQPPDEPTLWAGLPIPLEVARSIAVPNGELPEDLHLTLCFMGKRSELGDVANVQSIIEWCRGFAASRAPLEARVQGVGRFSGAEGQDVVYATLDAPGLVQLRQDVARAFADAGAPPKVEHDFVPHVTLAYLDPATPTPVQRLNGDLFIVDRFVVDVFGDRLEFPFTGKAARYFAASRDRWWERPLTAREQRAKQAATFAAIGPGLDAIVDRARRTMEREWQRAMDGLQHQVEGWIKSEKIGPREILKRIAAAELNLDGFEQALVDGSVEAWKFGGEQAVKELELAGADVVKKSSALSFQSSAKVAPDNPQTLGNFTALLKARAFTVRQGYEQKALSAIANALQTAYDNGLTPKEATARLDETFKGLESGHMIEPGTPGADYTKDAVQMTTVRTMAANSFNAARSDLFERNTGFVLGIELSEVAEGHDVGRGGLRSHPLSEWLHGLVIRWDDPRRKLLSGAKHFNDRKVDIPVTKLDEPVKWSSDAEIDQAIQKGRELSPRFF